MLFRSITHKNAATAPKQLEQFKTHDNPPGISGWLVEGRVIYDCFVLNEKADAVYYHGSQEVLRNLDVTVAKLGSKVKVMVVPEAESGNKWYYKLGTAAESVAYDADVSTGWTELSKSGAEVSISTNTVITVVEANASKKARAVGTASLT